MKVTTITLLQLQSLSNTQLTFLTKQPETYKITTGSNIVTSGTGLFGLAVSVWGHFGHDISVQGRIQGAIGAIVGVPNLSLTTYPFSIPTYKHVPFSIPTDKHVPLQHFYR